MAETTVNLHESNGESLVATCIALLVVSWIAVCLRSYTRIVLMKSYEVDDILMLIAQVSLPVSDGPRKSRTISPVLAPC